MFHVQSCTGVEELCWEGEEEEEEEKRRKSSGGSGAAFLHVLTGNHRISSCIMAFSQRWVVEESSSSQTGTMPWEGWGHAYRAVIPWCSGPWVTVPTIATVQDRRRQRRGSPAHAAAVNA